VERLLKEARSKAAYQRVLCVWLRLALGLTAVQIALAIGWRAGTVKKVHSIFLRQGEAALTGPGRGGRRNAYLTPEEEERFLSRYVEKASRGGMLVVSELKAAYEARIGRKVPKSTVYRMLARHGWRKLSPRPRHPEGDRAAQEAFKKTSRDGSPRS
jgi:transposase